MEYVLGHGPYEQVEPKWRGFMGGQYVVAIVTRGLRSLDIVMSPYRLETIEIPLRYVAQQVTNPATILTPPLPHLIHIPFTSRLVPARQTGTQREAKRRRVGWGKGPITLIYWENPE